MKITESKHIRQEVPKSTLEELAETPSTSLHKTLAAVGAQESTAFRPGSFKPKQRRGPLAAPKKQINKGACWEASQPYGGWAPGTTRHTK